MRPVVWACLFVSLAVVSAAAGPLDKPAFTATPAELLAEAKASTVTGHDVAVLRDDVSFTFDARGRVEERHRTVFTVLTTAGVDDWGEIGLGWQPFFQDQPTIRARVINTDGSVTDFDPSLMHDAPSVKESPSVYSDRRDLSAPLPRLAVGAVVEQEFVFVDREPLLAAGTVHWLSFQRFVPVARKVVTISSPTALGTKIVLRGPKVVWKPTTRTVGDRTIVRYDVSQLAAAEDGDTAAPVDHVSWPALGIATGASWAAIAADYRALVEAKLAAPVTVPPDLLGATPRATVDRLLAWLHGRVRYTGIELSASAIIPFAPAETLARGFGDCKDKATLLVALLRAAKIPADLALLSTGPGTDVDVALPGMGEFDHAIVRARVDGKDLWIDATEDLLPAGQLPMRDQGRRALIIAAGTKALTTTPVGAPVDNLVREVRTFQLSEDGPGRVTEVSEERGIWSDSMRLFTRNRTRDEAAKDLTTYTTREYEGTYRSHSTTAVGDVAQPFVFTLEVDDARRTGAQRDEAWVWLYPTDVLAKLPGTFTDDDAQLDARVAARKVDYLWSTPHVYEIENRLVLPPGFAPPELPATETRALGTMTLAITRRLTGGVYSITYRLDTGKRQITADQLRATRSAVLALQKEKGTQISLVFEATRLAEQGKVREAVAAIQRLAAAHPKEALHHVQLALRLHAIGLADAARREATLATTLDPKDGDAWMVLGYLLARDVTGREGSVGNDRAGALAALRKAVALSPTHIGARDELARLLTVDADGWTSSDRAGYREAATLLRGLRTERVVDNADARLTFALALGDDRAGLEALIRELPDGDLRREATVLTAAMRSGDEAARVATSLAGKHGREALLETAIGSLTLMRRYDDVRAVARSLPAMAATRRDALARLQPVDVARLPPRDPTTPIKLMLHRVTVRALTKPPWSPATDAAMADEAKAVMVRTLPSAVLTDSMIANAVYTVRGDAKAGWTVGVTLGTYSFELYVVLRNQRAYLLGGPQMLPGIGAEVHELLGRGDLATARSLLARVATSPDLTPGHLATSVLTRHRDHLATASKAQLELLGWMLLAEEAPQSAIAPLRACKPFPDVPDRERCLAAAAAIAAAHHDWPTATAIAREALPLSPDDPVSLGARALWTAFAPGGLADAEAALTAALAKHPDDPPLLRAHAFVGLATSWAVASPRFDRLLARKNPAPEDLNNAAWAHLYYDASPDVARRLIEPAVANGAKPDAHVRNTYAAVLAELGEPTAAWAQLALAVPLHAPLGDADWYVLGRIAEQAGLRDDAVALYRRLTPGAAMPGAPSSWDFAQKRLKAMGVTP